MGYKGRKKALSPEQVNELNASILEGEKRAQVARKYFKMLLFKDDSS